MRNTNTRLLGGSVVALGIVLLLIGCGVQAPKEDESSASKWQSFCQAREETERQMRANPCGFLEVRSPLLQVSGFLTSVPRDNTSLYLFIAPNTSLDAALYVAEHCAPIYHSGPTHAKRFTLPPLPEGDYIVMMDGRAFGSNQGFPVVDEIDDPSWTVDLAFHGGSPRYSMAAFSIHPKKGPTIQDDLSCGGQR